MDFLHSEIGSAKDNQNSPIHNWYKFTAGFSYKFVDEIIDLEKLTIDKDSQIFDPFAGCGTTLVSAQKKGVKAVGNESQEFMYNIIKGKLNWDIKEDLYKVYLELIFDFINDKKKTLNFKLVAHPLLTSLYNTEILQTLYLLKDIIGTIKEKKYNLFFKLALSQVLHKVSNHPIAIPYISRNKFLHNKKSVWETFEGITQQMLIDILLFSKAKHTSKIYLQDSRKANRFIINEQCSLCITSPPYLNNLDYGEVSKVHTHFFDITSSWNDITNKVRKKLVTGATTHYKETNFDMQKYLSSDFAIQNPDLALELVQSSYRIKEAANLRSGKKSFDILTLLYFEDMYKVLLEIRRVLKLNHKAYLILGDSAPYGILIPTTEILGKIALNIGFTNYEIQKIRTRGTKWKSLRYRHSLELSENVLILQ